MRLARPGDVLLRRRRGRVHTDGSSEVPALLAVRHRGVASTPTRVTAPWKCSNRIARHRRRARVAKRSTATSISSSGRPRREARQPVVERAGRVAVVEDRVHHRVRHRPDLDHQRRAPRLERREVALGLLRGAGVARRPSPASFMPEPSGACDERGEDGQVVGERSRPRRGRSAAVRPPRRSGGRSGRP